MEEEGVELVEVEIAYAQVLATVLIEREFGEATTVKCFALVTD